MSEVSAGVVDEEWLSSVYYDIAQMLESAEDSESRVIRVLQRLRSVVPYSLCAVLEALPARELRLVTPPRTPPGDQVRLLAMTTGLLGKLIAEREQGPEAPSAPGLHIAVPLVGLDQVIGVLFVEDSAGNT